MEYRMVVMYMEIGCFVSCLFGWILVCSTLPTEYWTFSEVSNVVLTTTNFYYNLWKDCVSDTTGMSDCKEYPSMLALPVFLHACRALAVCTVITGFFGGVLTLIGMKCTKIGGSEITNTRVTFAGGITYLVSDLNLELQFSLAGVAPSFSSLEGQCCLTCLEKVYHQVLVTLPTGPLGCWGLEENEWLAGAGLAWTGLALLALIWTWFSLGCGSGFFSTGLLSEKLLESLLLLSQQLLAVPVSGRQTLLHRTQVEGEKFLAVEEPLHCELGQLQELDQSWVHRALAPLTSLPVQAAECNTADVLLQGVHIQLAHHQSTLSLRGRNLKGGMVEAPLDGVMLVEGRECWLSGEFRRDGTPADEWVPWVSLV
ncbi:hypothetical protein FQN60_006613 [Etheostoma spectabile]|uniref:Uncharacterized protein n=1 Tax=Etheostoma spectabile TaxID=54343 RepID=A0A5J5CHE3_9PERO|nr:hypothetical protein FQN60_006613 [Etheostoma spectabile]